jgi:hypothetical protein
LQYQDTKSKATKEKRNKKNHPLPPTSFQVFSLSLSLKRSFVSPRVVYPLSLPNKQKKKKEYTHIYTYIRVIG